MPYDAQTINQQTDLLALIGADTPLHGGAEKFGPCPKCGGRDRFHVHPAEGWWFCRQCHPERGDAIAYLRWRDGLSFAEACERLGGGVVGARHVVPVHVPQQAPQQTHFREAEAQPPSAAWQERARQFLAYCQGQLGANAEALAYLRGRGLREESIRAAGLGYHERERRDRAARWGAEGESVWLPEGWVIPCENEGELWYVKIRRLDRDLAAARAWNEAHPGVKRPRPEYKYHTVRGSVFGGVLYRLDRVRGHSDVILCEGEFDALLLGQEVGPIAGVGAMGSVSKKPDLRAIAVLAGARRIWAAYDTDDPGQKGAEELAGLSGRIQVLLPLEHDITDMWLAGHDLLRWVAGGIGPRDPDRRRAWLEYLLEELDEAALEAGGDDQDPALRQWLAVYEAYQGGHISREGGP